MRQCAAACLRGKWAAASHVDTAKTVMAALKQAVQFSQALPGHLAERHTVASRCADRLPLPLLPPPSTAAEPGAGQDLALSLIVARPWAAPFCRTTWGRLSASKHACPVTVSSLCRSSGNKYSNSY